MGSTTLFDLPLEVVECFYFHCSGKDLVNVACCNKACSVSVRNVMWSDMKIQWKLLDTVETVAEKCKYINLTKSLEMYNGFRKCHDNSLGIGGYATQGFQHILNNCNPFRLRCLHFWFFISPGGLEAAARVLTELEELSLHNVQLTQTEDWKSVCEFTKLSKLRIYNCNISDTMLKKMNQLTHLRTLEVEQCRQMNTDNLLQHTSHLTSLKTFSLGLTRYHDDDDDDEETPLRLNVVSASSPVLNHLGLLELKLSLENLHDKFFVGIDAKLKHLTVLNVEECKCLTDKTLKHVVKLPELRELHIGNTKITDVGLRWLSQSTTLSRLYMTTCGGVTDVGLSHLAKMSALEQVHVYRCHDSITDAGLEALTSSTTISILMFTGSNLITNTGLEHIAKMTAKDICLCLDTCEKIDDAGILSLTALSATLTSLYVMGCQGISDVGMQHMSLLVHLDELDVSETEITSVGLSYITKLPLRSLEINNCHGVDDTGLLHVSEITTLHTLMLEHCDLVTDLALQYISRLSGLRQLDASFCVNITDEGIRYLAKLPLLRYLRVLGCVVSDEVLLNMAKNKTIIRD